MATENKGVCDFKVAVPALMDFLSTVGYRVLLQFRWPVEAFPTNGAFVGIVLGMNRYDVTLQVTGVGTFVITVGTMMGLILLMR